MSKVTTVEAADMAGVSRSTIWRACKSGRLSAERTGKDFLVEVSELERVFPLKLASPHETSHPVSGKPSETNSQAATQPDATELAAAYKRQVEMLEKQVEDLQHQRDWFKAQFEKEKEEQVRLLTDQRSDQQKRVADQVEGTRLRVELDQVRRPWWRRLIGK